MACQHKVRDTKELLTNKHRVILKLMTRAKATGNKELRDEAIKLHKAMGDYIVHF